MKTVTITLRNRGTVPADATIVETSDPDRFTTGPGPGIIPPGGSATLDVHFTSAPEAGTHTALLIIRACNLIIPLSAESIDPPEIIIDGSLGSSDLLYRVVNDEAGEWFEVGVPSPFEILPGNAVDGWTDPGGNLLFRFERSDDLLTWDHDFLESPATPEAVEPDVWVYWARCALPLVWKYVRMDMHLVTRRAFKSITNIELFGVNLALSGYPYAMPADAARLQTDIRALSGYSAATVSTSSQALAVEVRRHYIPAGGNYTVLDYQVTLSGNDVTQVRTNTGAVISLPGYPYTMPGAQATLQADLITAGHSGSVVRLFGDEWQIDLPARQTILRNRTFTVTFTPGDPHPSWDVVGISNGPIPDNRVAGTYDNLQPAAGGAGLQERAKQFVRMGISRGPNYQYD